MEQKIEKSCKAAFFCIRLCQVLLIITLVIFAAAIIWLAAGGGALLGNGEPFLLKSPAGFIAGMGNMLGNMNAQKLSGLPAKGLIAALAGQGAGGVILLVIFSTAAAIFRRASGESRPFLMENGRRLKKISYLMALLALAPTAVQLLVHLALAGGMEGLSLDVDMTSLLYAVLFFALANIFEYGAVLQRQADETL